MKSLTKDQKQEVATKLRNAVSLADLVNILNSVQELTMSDGEKPKLITSKSLTFLLYSRKAVAYNTFKIAKKSGGEREITAPNKFLKYIQRLVNQCLHSLYYPMPQAHGFIPERNIVTNAIPHCGKKYVYNIDLKDFFPSISYHRVNATLHRAKQFKLNQNISSILANLCCHEGRLPQGAPTSPTLSNFVCISLDYKFYFLSKEKDFTYTRYADDITISSNVNLFTDEFKAEISRLIDNEGFELNPKKERLQKNNVVENGVSFRQHQEVTGIVVNQKPNVNKKYTRNLEATLFNWEKYGYDIASMLHEHYYKFSKGSTRYNGDIPSIENVVMGRLEYLGMVRGKTDSKYQYLKTTFDSLCMKKSYTEKEFEDILLTWQTKGIKAAMNMFYDKRNLQISY